MKNFTKELKNILTEEYGGTPILSPDEVRGRANTTVILTNQAPKELLALAGPSREAILLNFKPLMITFPYQKGVYKVQPDDIVFENHHSGRDVTEAGSEETSYEKFFAAAMKKFGVSSPIELSPEDTKKFFNYVDKNWDAEEESDGSKNEILPALARGAMAVGRAASAIGSMGDSNDIDEVSREEKARRKKDVSRETEKRKTDRAKKLRDMDDDARKREREKEQKKREKEADRERRQGEIKKKAAAQKARNKETDGDRAKRDYEKETERKAAERTREKEQKRAKKEKERQRKKKRPSSIGKKLGVGMGADAAVSKVSSAAQGALSKYKSKDSGI